MSANTCAHATVPASLTAKVLLPEADYLRLDEIVIDGQDVTITTTSCQTTPCCPSCGVVATRAHTRYTRRPGDLPCVGRQVRLRLNVRRFFCDNRACQQRTFVERLPGVVAASPAGPHAWPRSNARSGWRWAVKPAPAARWGRPCRSVLTPCCGWPATPSWRRLPSRRCWASTTGPGRRAEPMARSWSIWSSTASLIYSLTARPTHWRPGCRLIQVLRIISRVAAAATPKVHGAARRTP